jgi:hypothetical protein
MNTFIQLLLFVWLSIFTVFFTTRKVTLAKPASSSVRTAAVTDTKVLSPNLLFEEKFEGVDPLTALRLDFAAAYSTTVSNTLAFSGTKALRMELRDTDEKVNGGTRTEIYFTPEINKNRWYSFAAYFPSSSYASDRGKEIITQWHQWPDADLGEDWRSPSMALLIIEDHLVLNVAFDVNQLTTEVRPVKKFDLGLVPKDQWTEFVFHVIHSYGSDGLVQVFKNDILIFEHKGGNMYNDAKLPYWKLGVYKWLWNDNGTTDVSKRILYYDNIRIGNEKASLAHMTSKPTVISYTLVNADTDKDIRTITGDATISLASLRTKNINIRANTNSGATGSVGIRLWGSGAKAAIDNVAPYSLFWEANGNYTPWVASVGTYTIRATPFSLKDEKGTAGVPLTINLTFTQ